VPRVELTAIAIAEIEDLIESHELPDNTWVRVFSSLSVLEQFPHAGRALPGPWEGFRVIVGPWGWMLLIYEYIEKDDQVVVVTAEDARRSSSATSLGT
jgi:hypothetical protein